MAYDQALVDKYYEEFKEKISKPLSRSNPDFIVSLVEPLKPYKYKELSKALKLLRKEFSGNDKAARVLRLDLLTPVGENDAYYIQINLKPSLLTKLWYRFSTDY